MINKVYPYFPNRFNRYIKYLSVGILFIVSLNTPLKSYAQRGNCIEIKNVTALNMYAEALQKPKIKFKERIHLLENALKIVPNFSDAHYLMAEINYKQAKKLPTNQYQRKKAQFYYNKAEDEFLKVLRLCPSFNYYASYYYLGKYYYDSRKFEQSGFFLKNFLKHNSEDSRMVSESHKMLVNINSYIQLIQNPVPFNPKPLANVCTSDDEYLPIISPDEELLIFSRQHIKYPNTSYEENVEQLNLSHRIYSKDSLNYIYSLGRVMHEPFNDGRNQGGATITIDNNHIFITICEYERANYTSYKNCDIFTSDYLKNKWGPLRRMGKQINGQQTFEGMPSISTDGKVLFYTSAREGGYGGLDIYKSVKDKNGNWSEAQNLGPVINTPGDEKTPFIHSDSQTLYFASNGRFGLGGFDVFFSKYKGLGEWTKPKNIGYPINTEKDELGLIVSANGKHIFFSSKILNNAGNWDIYSAKLYDSAQPQKVLFVKGKLYDTKGKKVKKAKVELKSLQTNEKTNGMVDDLNGNYAVAVPVKKNEKFIMTVKKEGYLYYSIYIDPNKKEYDPPTNKDIKIKKIKKDEPVRLNNINFAFESYKLTLKSEACLNSLVEFLKENPEIRISILGHTDNSGDRNYNITLSLLRAKAVKDYLCSRGINNNRVSFKGYGETKPLSSNATKKGRAINRRVEFIIK